MRVQRTPKPVLCRGIMRVELGSAALRQLSEAGDLRAQIVRIKTRGGVSLGAEEMRALCRTLNDCGAWGLNMGETQATFAGWSAFAKGLPGTSVGFVFVEIPRSGGLRQLLRPLLCGSGSALRRTRRRLRDAGSPCFDGGDPVHREPLARKFLFNPCNSAWFRSAGYARASRSRGQ